MKARDWVGVFTLAGACLCNGTTARSASDSGFVFLNPDDAAFAQIRRQGDRIIDQVGSSLILELRRILATTTAAQAVPAVHLKDWKFPDPVAGQPRVLAVRRTSTQVRDPRNAPDAADQSALDRIAAEINDGDEVSKVLLQRVTFPGRPDEWRVYRPLVALKQCVDCHGDKAALAPGVAAALATAYPEDQATGYRPGQWRGLIRVSLDWETK